MQLLGSPSGAIPSGPDAVAAGWAGCRMSLCMHMGMCLSGTVHAVWPCKLPACTQCVACAAQGVGGWRQHGSRRDRHVCHLAEGQGRRVHAGQRLHRWAAWRGGSPVFQLPHAAGQHRLCSHLQEAATAGMRSCTLISMACAPDALLICFRPDSQVPIGIRANCAAPCIPACNGNCSALQREAPLQSQCQVSCSANGDCQ